MKEKVTVGLIQRACGPEREENFRRTLSAIAEAAQQGAQIICLQELFDLPYFPQQIDRRFFRIAEKLPSEHSKQLADTAGKHRIVLIASVYEEVQPGISFNTALVFDSDGKCIGKYRKNHIPGGRQYYEKYYFTPGTAGYPVFDTAFGRLAVGICYDQWFPEVARLFALQGAQIIFYPSAIGNEPDRPGYSSAEAWQTAMRGHAICNALFVAAVNRVGRQGKMRFYGHSFVCNPFGQVLGAVGEDEATLLVEIDYQQIRDMREMFHFFRDRRPETYGTLISRVIESTGEPL